MTDDFWQQASEAETLALELYEMVYALNHSCDPNDTRSAEMRAKALRTRGRHLAEHLDKLLEVSGGEVEG